MSTQIKSFSNNPNQGNMQLLSKLEGHQDIVNAAIIIPGEDGVISISEDKTIRIWLKRDRGAYWPSVCHVLSSPASSMDYHSESKRLFVGMDNGYVSEFNVANDYNRIKLIKNFFAHQGRVKEVLYSPQTESLLSVGRDKNLVWFNSENGNRIGSYMCKFACSSLQFDHQSGHAFVGDVNGQIEMIKLENNSFRTITTLKGHSSIVRCLEWDSLNQLLFSGGSDKSIICWDIGGKKGTAYELQGHNNVVTSLYFSHQSRQILSSSEDSMIVGWNMNCQRQETPEWAESDFCQLCNRPFFWNVRAMYDQKTIGFRQHHCRLCGKAICDQCSPNRSTLPKLGYEFPVRLCTECYPTKVQDSDRVSLAKFYESKHCVNHMSVDEPNKLMVTSGFDRVIKLWDISGILV